MNTEFETKKAGGKSGTVEWYTPPYIIDALGGKFDLDPCAPKKRLVHSKDLLYKRRQWVNPGLVW